jgi:hypothetical protein
MPLFRDARGLDFTAASEAAVKAYDVAIDHYLGNCLDTADRIADALKADPGFVMGHVLKGDLTMLLSNVAYLPAVAKAIAAAEAGSAAVTPREHAHLEALKSWHAGREDKAIEIWAGILAQYPTDLLAMRLSHFSLFWRGEAPRMRALASQAVMAWDPNLPGYGFTLGMLSFGHEETGDYREAERLGRAAVERNSGDTWATHAVAHVMEMQGRHRDGIAWLEGLAPAWAERNNFVHHLWWHRALYHLELGEGAVVLDLYDRRVRPLDSIVVQKQPDMYIDVQNAVSLLWRMEAAGLDVGNRWAELADKAEKRIGDHILIFTLPHFMMALAADGRDAAAARMLATMRDFASRGASDLAKTVGEVAVPVSEAVLAHRRGDHARAIALILPIRDQIVRLGGSHAQRDLFTQVLLDAALKAGERARAKEILASIGQTHPAWLKGRAIYDRAARTLAA